MIVELGFDIVGLVDPNFDDCDDQVIWSVVMFVKGPSQPMKCCLLLEEVKP